ncbi:MAG: class I SAM-dependent methyltransferase [Parvularculaceae bacterium]|nr:class I SAM-dependent methyltransferase [Parvularculaceae bacterium]
MTRSLSKTIDACRSCGANDLQVFLDLGETPLADRLLRREDLGAPEPRFPLKAALCAACGLVQITETVDPEILFADHYPYYSSFSPALLAHSRANVLDIIEKRGLTRDSFVIELASNDGYLLKNYVEAGVPVLGIDPADGPAAAATSIGVPTLNAFFTRDLAERLRAEGKTADVVHGNNVLAHVADTNGFVAGVRALLKDDGVAVIEAPYLKPLIDHVEFDTIYHEHLLYLSVTAVDRLARRHGLLLNEIRHLDIHGGSLRYYFETRERVGESVVQQLALERDTGLDRLDYFLTFSDRVQRLKVELVALLRRLKAEGKSIAAYGAAAKGATLINYFGIGTDLVDFVVDRNVHKQGKFMPGQRLPIRAPEALVEARPDYVLMLAWNFADEIIAQQERYRSLGGKFIVPIPSLRIV